MKKITSMIIMMCMVLTMLTIPVNAYEYCCNLSIDDIVCQDEKVIVNFTTNSSVDDRDVHVTVELIEETENSTSGAILLGKNITVASGEQSDSVEFDASMFITGAKYRIELIFAQECEQGMCQWREVKDFVMENGGMPVYELSDTYSDEITVSSEPIALKMTAKQDGMYKLFVNCDELWCLDIDCATNFAVQNIMYLKAGETKYFTACIDDYATEEIQSCKAEFKADFADFSVPEQLKKNPGDGDIVFSITDLEYESYAELEIPKSGLYKIFTECEDDGWNYLISTDGEMVVNCEFEKKDACYLEAGTYYYIAETSSASMDWEDNSYVVKRPSFTTTFVYGTMDTLQFGKEITLDSYGTKYYSFTLDTPAILKKEDISGGLSVFLESEGENRYLSDYPNVFLAGDYVLECSGEGSAVVTKTDIPIVTIGDDISYYKDWEYKYVVLKAPETAEYEIYFSGSYSQTIAGENVDAGYNYITMDAGETVIVEMYGDDADMTAKKYQKTYTSAALGSTELNFERSQRAGVSFTADEDDIYCLAVKNDYNWTAYFDEIKIYTAEKTLYEGKDVYVDPVEITLKKDETVYIDAVGGDWKFIDISKLTINGDTVIDCSAGDTHRFAYAPSEEGYYNVTASKTGGDGYTYVRVYVNDIQIGSISNDSTQVNLLRYIASDMPLRIKLEISDGQNTEVTLSFAKAESKEIENTENFEITDGSYYSFTLPEDGVYKISGTALYKKSSWRDEGVYAYFFAPIIKNNTAAYFSYDAQEGEAPIIFCGKEGDVVLFKEEPEENYEFEYPISASITKIDAEKVQLDTQVTTSDDYVIYCVEIVESGVYKIEDFSESGVGDGHGYTCFHDGNNWVYIQDMLYGSNKQYAEFELEAGTYYMIAATYDWYEDDEYVPTAGFRISQVKPEMSAVKSEQSVTYMIGGSIPENATLYIALYDGGKLMGIKQIETPMPEETITFEDKIDGYSCKLFLWNKMLEPFCQSIVSE